MALLWLEFKMEKTMRTDSSLGHYLRSFFEDHLIKQRNVSPHTVLAYRDAIKLFLLFGARRCGKSVAALAVDDLDADAVVAFLEYLEAERKVSAATRNHRLAALHSLYRHIAGLNPEKLYLCQRILAVPFKRAQAKPVGYLERDELGAILSQPDRSTVMGRRDHALLAFLYNTGCRVHEAVNVRASDLQLQRPFQVRILGKGRKERVCPLWPRTAALMRQLLSERVIDPASDAPVFINRTGQPLTRFGVRYILNKYQRSASEKLPAIKAKRIHPHIIRHSTAVHLLQSGVELNVISALLGHASITTTSRYAEIDLAMKRRALETAAPDGSSRNSAPKWKWNKGLMAWLESL